MIARYTRPELAALWSDDRRLELFLQIELCACAALEGAPGSPIPAGVSERLRAAARAGGPLSATRISELEQRTQHELLAFLTHVEERLGPEARFLHFGLTSSDVLDSALAIQLRDATDLILGGLRDALLPALREQAEAHKDTPMIGRTHGIHAEPVTAGLLFLSAYAELQRAKDRIERARAEVAVGKLSGAVGVYGSGQMSPAVEAAALAALGLGVEPVATQVVARDRHAALFLALALLAAAIERLAINLRHMQRSEVGEVQEAFAAGQKGSSAMPHKKNPISAENLCGLSRLCRAQAHAALEDIALWHERDISHSSVERVIAPDVTTLADYMVQRAARLVRGLVIKKGRMAHNLALAGELHGSEKVMLELVQSGLSRQTAYEIVQRHALASLPAEPDAQVQAQVQALGFAERLTADPEVAGRVPAAALRACFDLDHHLRHVPAIFARVLAQAEPSTPEGEKDVGLEAMRTSTDKRPPGHVK
jgi:adenylosuccinate lyase